MLSQAWRGSPGYILVQDKLVGGTACVESVFIQSLSSLAVPKPASASPASL